MTARFFPGVGIFAVGHHLSSCGRLLVDCRTQVTHVDVSIPTVEAARKKLLANASDLLAERVNESETDSFRI